MSSEIFSGSRNVVGSQEMPFKRLPRSELRLSTKVENVLRELAGKTPEHTTEVLNLTPQQVQIFELQAIGLTKSQIADKLGIEFYLTEDEISKGLKNSGQLTSIHVISRLLESGQIDREKIAEGLDFEDYRLLTKREKEVLDYVANPSTWGDKEYTLARGLGISKSTFKHHLTAISNKLELPTPNVLLRSRVFMLLLREQEKGDFSQQIKGYREKLGLTQRDLALKTGVDHSGISKLESSKRDPKASTVFALSIGLGLSAEQTIGLLESAHQEHKEKFSTLLPKQKTSGE